MTVLTADEIRAYCEPLSIGMVTADVPRLYFERCSDCRVYVGQFADTASPLIRRVARKVGTKEYEH